jgi:hypothetical protein
VRSDTPLQGTEKATLIAAVVVVTLVVVVAVVTRVVKVL